MEQLTSKYENVFIVSPELTEEAAKALCEKFTGLITSNGGIVDSVNEWGKKKLAYPINDLTEGYYTLINFTSAPEFPAELERVYGITDGILRNIVIRSEEA